MSRTNSNKLSLLSCLTSFLLGLNTNSVLAEEMPPCPSFNGVTLEDFLPEACETSLIGIDQSKVRFATVDIIRGDNFIEFGAARHIVQDGVINSCSVGIEVDDDDDDDDFDPASLSDIQLGQQVAFLIDDPSNAPRRINQLWVLNCSIVQER